MNQAKLTLRQRECLRHVRKGLTSLQIAAELGLSIRTVNQYIADACHRLGARNRAQAAVEAVLRGEA